MHKFHSCNLSLTVTISYLPFFESRRRLPGHEHVLQVQVVYMHMYRTCKIHVRLLRRSMWSQKSNFAIKPVKSQTIKRTKRFSPNAQTNQSKLNRPSNRQTKPANRQTKLANRQTKLACKLNRENIKANHQKIELNV